MTDDIKVATDGAPVEETYEYNALVCPYCKHRHNDVWEDRLEDGVETDYECDHCERTFVAVRDITITYTGKPKESPHDH